MTGVTIRTCPTCGVKVKANFLERHRRRNHVPKPGPQEGRAAVRERRRRTAGLLRGAALVAVVAVIIGGIYLALIQVPLTGGAEAPDFTVTDTTGTTQRLSDYQGKPVLLVLLRGTWCKICEASMPAYREAAGTYGPQGLVILTVSLDPGDTNALLEDYKARHDLSWPHALDTDGVAAKYKVTSAGTVYFITAEGRVHSSVTGIHAFKDIRPALDDLVGR